MLPAGQGGDVGQPAVYVGPVIAVEAEGFGVVEIAAAGEVGDGRSTAHDPAAPRQMGVERGIGVPEPRLHEGDDILRALVFGQEVHQEPRHPRLRGHLVIVPQDPAQDLLRLALAAAEPAGAPDHMVHDRAGLAQDPARVFEDRHLAHDIELAERLGAGGAVEEVDEDRFPVVARKGKGQRGLVGVAAFAEAVESCRHAALPWLAGRAGVSHPRAPVEYFDNEEEGFVNQNRASLTARYRLESR